MVYIQLPTLGIESEGQYEAQWPKEGGSPCLRNLEIDSDSVGFFFFLNTPPALEGIQLTVWLTLSLQMQKHLDKEESE